MENKPTPLERFHNLTVSQQTSILDKHRYHNTEYINWWDFCEEDFREKMSAIGVGVDNISFSLAYCQSDYAEFAGSIEDWALFLKSMGYNCPALINLAKGFWSCRIYTNHRGGLRLDCDLPYPTEETTEESDVDDMYCPYQTDIQRASWYALINRHNLHNIEKEILDVLRSHAAHLYHQLRDEYEYLTSDVTVLESLDANDLLEDELAELENDDA